MEIISFSEINPGDTIIIPGNFKNDTIICVVRETDIADFSILADGTDIDIFINDKENIVRIGTTDAPGNLYLFGNKWRRFTAK